MLARRRSPSLLQRPEALLIFIRHLNRSSILVNRVGRVATEGRLRLLLKRDEEGEVGLVVRDLVASRVGKLGPESDG